MKIAIIVWGSLYWDIRNLETTGEWFYDGPLLPIEYARISNDKRLTLVIKPNFDSVTTLYAISSKDNLREAIENLQSREETENINNIGFLNFALNAYNVRPAHAFIIEIFKNWNKEKKFDAVIWSDFSPRFQDKIEKPFTLENVINYINTLSGDEKTNALNYIKRAPLQISTRFRKEIQEHFNE